MTRGSVATPCHVDPIAFQNLTVGYNTALVQYSLLHWLVSLPFTPTRLSP